MPDRQPSLNRTSPSGPRRVPAKRLARLAPLLLCLATLPAALSADQYDYQDRGDRSEGIRPRPVSGDDIALISARAAPVGGPTGAPPERMRLSFILPPDASPERVRIAVRELDYRHYYWMDKVHGATPWRSGAANAFHWPTQEVLGWLFGRGLQPADLGAVVRLSGSDAPSPTERVAPALLSGDDAPVTVTDYLFTFKTNLPARLTCTLSAYEAAGTLWSKTFERVGAGRPFTCRVPVAGLAAGKYLLRVDGWSLATNEPVQQEVRFTHDPALQ